MTFIEKEKSGYEFKLFQAWIAAFLASFTSGVLCFMMARYEASESNSFPILWAINVVVWIVSSIVSASNANAHFRSHSARIRNH